jgi:hypothetical protein
LDFEIKFGDQELITDEYTENWGMDVIEIGKSIEHWLY